MILPAISIRQPWAYAILHLGKDVENRTWDLPSKYRGARVLIHAGKEFDHNGYIWLVVRDYALPVHARDFPTGGIVGELTFKDSVAPGPRSLWAESGLRWWHIDCAKPLPFFSCEGRLGFFTVDYPCEAVNHEVA